ncbi:MAG TPA: histidine phosphatase family protein [Candidatus Didemnitutus sp.]|nr:histidine phosphatase family protein [Candidatus Didemnitutus sp.]
MILRLLGVLGVTLLGVGLTIPVAASESGATPHLRTIYLIRHGQAETSGRGDETAVNGLTNLGIAQAKLIGARLRGTPVVFDALISSPFLRARQTAAVIHESLPGLEVKYSELLHETLPRTRQVEVTKDMSPAELDEAEKQLNEAFVQFFQPVHETDRHEILVCHGNVIRYLVTKALGVDTQAWLGMGLANCSLTIIQVRPDGSCKVLAVGDTGHLPANLVSGWGRPEPQLIVPDAGAKP